TRVEPLAQRPPGAARRDELERVRADGERDPLGAEVLPPDVPAGPAQDVGVPRSDGCDVGDGDGHGADRGHAVRMGRLARNALLARRLVLDEERGGDDEGVDALEHQRPPKAGATSSRNRLSCPRWSQDVSRSAMWPTPASKYARSSATHCFGLPATVHCSTNRGVNFAV